MMSDGCIKRSISKEQCCGRPDKSLQRGKSGSLWRYYHSQWSFYQKTEESSEKGNVFSITIRSRFCWRLDCKDII